MTGSRRSTPNDPGRRERILDATLEVIAEVGFHQTTYRRVAAQADVPLGSVSYYFDTIDELLVTAFTALASRMEAAYRARMQAATTPEEAANAVVDIICGPYAADLETTLLFEMYAFANHNAEVARVARDWLYRSRESLGLHFPPATCLALDVLIEGWPMHRAFENAELDRALVTRTVSAVIAAF